GADPVVLHDDLLLLHPRAPDVLQRLAGARDADLDGILEALVRLGSDLGDAGDGHGVARSAEGEGSGPIRDRAGPWAETPSGKRGAAEVAVGPDRAPRS